MSVAALSKKRRHHPAAMGVLWSGFWCGFLVRLHGGHGFAKATKATYKRTGQLERNIIATLFFILAFCLVFSVAHTCLNPNACEAERSRRIANQEQAMRLRLEIDRLKASFAAQPAWSAKELEEPQDPAAEQVPADSTAVQVPAEEERHSAMAEGTPAEEEAGDDAGDSAALSQKRGFLSQE